MGKPTGFMEFERETFGRRPVSERVNDWFEVYQPLAEDRARTQGARCMDCGVPFCHTGCPLTNLIPDWNDMVFKGRWQQAIRELHATNNFPEFTSRICPAPCEASCVLGINEPPVSIKTIERAIIDRAWEEGWIHPEPPLERTGKRVAVVGSGPAGLAAAQQLARKGHLVTVFEKNDRIGGLLRYGIPDFKLEKRHIDRRMRQLEAEGVTFRTNCHAGVDISAEEIRRQFHALLLTGGSEQPRDLSVPGRELKGIYFAMDFLPLNNRRNAGDMVPENQWISAEGKNVIIIGGGDTGADCLGTSIRQKAKSILQFEIMPLPPAQRSPSTPWPLWPYQVRYETSHEEGGERLWSIQTIEFLSNGNGHVRAIRAVNAGPPPSFEPIPGTERTFDADLVLLAMGFTGPVKNGILDEIGVEFDPRGNVRAGGDYMTSVPGVFAAGDMRRGQSLVVWAMAEGRQAAEGVDAWLRAQTGSETPAG